MTSVLISTEPQAKMIAWATEKLGHPVVPPCTAVGAQDAEGRLIAVLLFNEFYQKNIAISLAGDRLPRKLLRAAYQYAGTLLGCHRASIRARADDTRTQSFIEHLGARKEAVQRFYYGDCDCFLYGIMKEDFPFKG